MSGDPIRSRQGQERHRSWWRTGVCVLIAGAVVLFAGDVGASARPAAPVLGQPWSTGQDGYGEARPQRIFNGGDPTGLVTNIKWSHWGDKKAVGWGRGLFVWPGRSVAEGRRARARVVAYHRGKCGGGSSYNAIQWFYPRYGERFHRSLFLNTCSGDYHLDHSDSRDCRDVDLPHLQRAVEIRARHMNCRQARRLIASSPAVRYAVDGGRFVHRGYYCGSMGWGESGPPSLFECARDLRSVTFEMFAGGSPAW